MIRRLCVYIAKRFARARFCCAGCLTGGMPNMGVAKQ
jgi:hypothetical protein